MSKVLVGLAIMWFMVSGVAFGQTYQQEINAGQAKTIAGDYMGARTNFENALILAKSEDDKSEVNYHIGQTYFREKNYIKTREIYTALVANKSAYILFIAEAQYHIATSYMRENNNVSAIIEWVKFLTLPCGEDLSAKKIILEYKETALKRLNALNANWNEVIIGMTIPEGWSGYYYRSRVKVLNNDKKGALQDLNAGLKLLSQENKTERQTMLSERETISMDGFGISYSEYVAKYGEP